MTKHMSISLQIKLTEGSQPRHFLLSPDGLSMVVANQDVDRVEAIPIDPVDGTLGTTFYWVQVQEQNPTFVVAVN